ncbi:type VI secretion system baseplate subunit TssG [Hymenobacter crusticola]|uniref:Uncharacterized protein n=1 Tax=Hymenobacter crusticola TaxID=1770526 RepID=A0A243WGE0_9BACT|nr:type VI secretion system baseplate subunit TssG [Hymenobacter crusticola]OUJ74800.1 hypothetical protein BXP70_08575 [Hymenobacter crusticola]
MLPPDSAASRPAYLLNQLELDYRSEVVAAELLASENGEALPLARFVFNPLGPTTRPYATDFTPPQFLAAEGSEAPYWRLDIPREGLYDQLPPFLFHPIQPTQGNATDAELLLEQVQQAHAVEQETRQFFLPFDTELHYLRVLRCWQERQHDHLEYAPALLAQFAEGWPILRRLDAARASLFIQCLPLIHQLRGNLPWLEQLLAIFFGVPARFETERPSLQHTTNEPTLRLGQSRLGIDAIAGSAVDEGYDAIYLHLGPVPEARTAEFLPHGAARSLLGEVLAYFVPATAEVIPFITIERATSAHSQPATSYLGYNSYL